MIKKMISVKIPRELYNRYRGKLNFSGLLTELLENISIVDDLDLSNSSTIGSITNTINGKPYHLSIKDLIAYVTYISGVNKK